MTRRWQNYWMGACPTLKTERLTLRPFRDDDLADYFAMENSPEVREGLLTPDDFGQPDASSKMAAWLGQWELRGTGHWAVEEKETGQFVGSVGLNQSEVTPLDWPGVEVGWTLHPNHWGCGYATEAGAAAVKYGFDKLGESRLFSCIVADNSRSQAVAQRLGFELITEKTMSLLPTQPAQTHQIWALDAN